MAIMWTVLTIKPVCVSEFRADVSATIVNDDPNTGYTETFPIKNATIQTPAQKLAVLDQLWNKYQEYLARQAVVDAWIDTAETDGLENLNERLT